LQPSAAPPPPLGAPRDLAGSCWSPVHCRFCATAPAESITAAAAAAAAAAAQPLPSFGGVSERRPARSDPAARGAGAEEPAGPSGRGGGAGAYPAFDNSPGGGGAPPAPPSGRRSARGEELAGARGSGTAVKMGRREAWARFLAYEVRRAADGGPRALCSRQRDAP